METPKKNIEYADKSWNPYHGCHGIVDGTCAVGKNCWAYRRALMLGANPKVKGYDRAQPFWPAFDRSKLDIPLKRRTPTRWDTCFMGDIAYAKTEWLVEILAVVHKCPDHRFYFLTKRPDVLAKKGLEFPTNAWVGVTVNEQKDQWRIDALVDDIKAWTRYVSFEPIYSLIAADLTGIDWVIIGAQTNPEIQPEREWVEEIIMTAEFVGAAVFTKENLTVIDQRREFPQ